MRQRAACLLLVLASMSVPDVLLAQEAAGAKASVHAYSARSGDAWIDARLADLNVYAPRYPDAFADEIARYLEVPRGYVVALGQQPGWAPGDVYMACALGKALARPCREVVRARASDDTDGWNGVAARLQGGKARLPAPSVRALLKTSYAHWARPLP